MSQNADADAQFNSELKGGIGIKYLRRQRCEFKIVCFLFLYRSEMLYFKKNQLEIKLTIP